MLLSFHPCDRYFPKKSTTKQYAVELSLKGTTPLQSGTLSGKLMRRISEWFIVDITTLNGLINKQIKALLIFVAKTFPKQFLRTKAFSAPSSQLCPLCPQWWQPHRNHCCFNWFSAAGSTTVDKVDTWYSPAAFAI